MMLKYTSTLLTIFLFLISYSQTENDFIMTYEVDYDTGLGVKYPFSGGDFTIDVGDGTILTDDDVANSSIHHTYSAPGIYTIIVSGDINRVYYNGGSGYYMKDKVKSIEQWGSAQWITMENAFYGLKNLVINATDTPDLSLVTTMINMFNGCHSLNSPMNDWDVSNVTDMSSLFNEAFAFNQPLDTWDVSNVTNMQSMFGRALSFNQNINSWDVSNVTNMVGMFGFFPEDNGVFNQPLNDWNVSNVTDMYWMFRNAYSFNQPLNNWNVSNVVEFGFMFYNASSFNQNLNDWDTSNAISMRGMFQGSSSFNEPLNDWDLSNNLSIREMFKDATSFNQPVDNWNTTNVISMKGVFHNATMFNQDISSWNFENVSDFSSGSTSLSFVGYTSMNTDNYDALLLALVQSGLQNKTLQAYDIDYCDSQVRSYLENELDWWIIGDNLSSSCIAYSISGTFLYDIDNNGCDDNDIPVEDLVVNATGNNFNYGATVLNGSYSIAANEGDFNLNVVNLPDYFTANPATETSTLNSTNTTEIIDFCLTANQNVEDLNITILPTSDARPGFVSTYSLVIKNMGTEIINNVSSTFTFDDTKQSFISANPSESSALSNSIDFSLGTLQPFQSKVIDITMQNVVPPTLNADDVLNFTAVVMPNVNDYTPNDNTDYLDQIVVNAFDPNDKRVLQGETITVDETNEYLDYIIRFQNTGSANATFVIIEDVLDSELDWSTLQIVSSSHDYQVSITNNNEVQFLFDNINLPYEAVDEPNSKGYIAYKIKPIATTQIGDIMSGNASIYFDYNSPIITNTVSTEVVQNLSTDDYDFYRILTVYPYPILEYFKLNTTNNAHIDSVEIYTISGKLLKTFSESESYNVKDLNPGFYILKIKTDQNDIVKKLIKS
ncbi:BspA family leucine-rich repeat surface protein [uncultured Winogradskyella sp.]|uniref:BspA family leucine-rich repeat surface protein n=1 Tax=uncultured Winogradskyella sp. TaxID=395353 RepID=UPI00261A7756|nr:BspA family leucine-rich repeat surface protein [uncultured Winogradskyella sp.]